MPLYISVTPLPHEGMYQLNEGIIIDGNHIPNGYKFNGASIPWVIRPLIGSPFDPEFMGPSLDHDYSYEFGVYRRKTCDQRFRKLLLVNGVDEEKAEFMFAGVRKFGSSHYNKEAYELRHGK